MVDSRFDCVYVDTIIHFISSIWNIDTINLLSIQTRIASSFYSFFFTGVIQMFDTNINKKLNNKKK